VLGGETKDELPTQTAGWVKKKEPPNTKDVLGGETIMRKGRFFINRVTL